MGYEFLILILGALAFYFLVLCAHSQRNRFGPAHFYALIGGITAIMSWVTDAGVKVQVLGITFLVGSAVFYTSLLLGVFVVYVFDGPRATRTAISTIIGVSIMMPIVAMVLHFQSRLIGNANLSQVPLPSLRINTASVIATFLDMIFLAIAWEYFGKSVLKIRLWVRTFLTLLGVMWLDVILFATGAFSGQSDYFSIMRGTMISRFIIAIFALPFLYGYLRWQSNYKGITIENRPVLSILKEVAEIKEKLSLAKQELEIERTYARIDYLTGITNSRAFKEMAKNEINRCARFGRPLTIAYIDIDNFKQVNDTLGHSHGDDLLQLVAKTIRDNTRSMDVVSRVGGDEFAILFPETNDENAKTAVNKLRNKLLYVIKNNNWPETFSFGVVRCYQPCDLDELIKKADNLMYSVKGSGKNRVEFDIHGIAACNH
jgi:diguanylate cyclase (GGDEF)-like protein